MTEIHLRLTASPAQLVAAGQHLSQRRFGLSQRLALAALLIGGGLLFGGGISILFGTPWLAALVISLYASLGTILAGILAFRLNQRRFLTAFSVSDLRARPVGLTLSPEGLTVEPRSLAWASVTATSRWQAATLLHFGTADALVIPDADLPPGLTPETLAAQIAAWKSA
ncbi:hypothetical protein LHP98_15500 [Rhodobacter sp. Har01]|uniref:hypothetical protein n=1 Tax=Rhodobacter sp. Har01 TaxID=2883999 RepID=UPI001D06033F|nr:hypothetical protein [Rhodobacter sp. Har01]MCB6179528.1 hypothetical protein [Rhodobacter sp. Har01]